MPANPPDDPADPDLPGPRGGKAAVIPAAAAGRGRRGLDRRRIVGAAIEYIDEHGIAALTMRRLGAHLGVEAMALYRHVENREDLLDGVVEAVIDELYGDPDVYIEPRHGWADYLQRLAHGVRRLALVHPAVFPLVATRPPEAPWVRPPLRSLRWVESLLTALTSSGFTDTNAVTAYRAYSSFLLGHLLLEVSQHGVPIHTEDNAEEVPAAPGNTGSLRASSSADTAGASAPDAADAADAELASYPTTVALRALLSKDETIAEFEEALETLIDRLSGLRG